MVRDRGLTKQDLKFLYNNKRNNGMDEEEAAYEVAVTDAHVPNLSINIKELKQEIKRLMHENERLKDKHDNLIKRIIRGKK